MPWLRMSGVIPPPPCAVYIGRSYCAVAAFPIFFVYSGFMLGNIRVKTEFIVAHRSLLTKYLCNCIIVISSAVDFTVTVLV